MLKCQITEIFIYTLLNSLTFIFQVRSLVLIKHVHQNLKHANFQYMLTMLESNRNQLELLQ